MLPQIAFLFILVVAREMIMNCLLRNFKQHMMSTHVNRATNALSMSLSVRFFFTLEFVKFNIFLVIVGVVLHICIIYYCK